MRTGSLFSGHGGLDLAVEEVLGASPVWVCENDPAPARILAERFPDAPNLGDVTKADWSAVEPVDVLTGGFPCPDVSHAGRRSGLIRDGEGRTRSGLWGQMLRAIDVLRPSLVVAENVRGVLSARADGDVEPCSWCVGDAGAGVVRALGAVLADLADLGFDAEWVGLRAADVGACHGRFRVFIVAWPASDASDGVHGLDSGGVAGTAPGRERGHAGTGGGSTDRRGGTPAPLTLLPTPIASDAGGGGSPVGAPRYRGTSLTDATVRRREEFGHYRAAIERWEAVTGIPAPSPTEPTGKGGAHRLSPLFVEWMMGIPPGWVTDVPGLSRAAQLKALGNGVVPAQAAAALQHLLVTVQDDGQEVGRVGDVADQARGL